MKFNIANITPGVNPVLNKLSDIPIPKIAGKIPININAVNKGIFTLIALRNFILLAIVYPTPKILPRVFFNVFENSGEILKIWGTYVGKK